LTSYRDSDDPSSSSLSSSMRSSLHEFDDALLDQNVSKMERRCVGGDAGGLLSSGEVRPLHLCVLPDDLQGDSYVVLEG